MIGRDYTQVGGPDGSFRTTQWTQIQRLQTQNATHARELLGQLLLTYWKPVYCYLRRRGHGDAEAKDLTQGFIEAVALGRDLLGKADPARGRFRTYLLTALQTYVREVHRKAVARKRGGGARKLALHDLKGEAIPIPDETGTPEDAFSHAWAAELLDQTLAEVEADCRSAGLDVHWELFCARVIRPILEGGKPTPLPELCKAHGIDGEAKASNMIVTVKRRFQASFRRRLRESVADGEDLDREIQEVLKILARGRAGS